MAATRRLAAILAADVAGYSRLMGADEEGTHERLKAHRRELLDPKIAEHQGRIVKTTGDGVLAEFASVVDAVRCAVEVQRGMADRNAGTRRRAADRVPHRHQSRRRDRRGRRHLGDGVNIAARLEALAEPGGICVSGTVRDHVRDRRAMPSRTWASSSVKNIARPVRTFALRPEAIAGMPAPRPPAAPPPRSGARRWSRPWPPS